MLTTSDRVNHYNVIIFRLCGIAYIDYIFASNRFILISLSLRGFYDSFSKAVKLKDEYIKEDSCVIYSKAK